MEFEVLPVIDRMLALYAQPRTPERFQQYLALLHGESGNDLVLPLQYFNPMAREHVRKRLLLLREWDAETLMREAVAEWRGCWAATAAPAPFRIALNLADDLHGGWTNRYTTDYDSRFRLRGLANRQLAVVLFWVSEKQSPGSVRLATAAACLRTAWWLAQGQPETLEEHLAQERAVFAQLPPAEDVNTEDFDRLEACYAQHRDSRDAQLIFNFLYGDEAAEAMGNRPLNIGDAFPGLRFAMAQAQGTGS